MKVPESIRRTLLASPALAAEDQPVVERFFGLCERYAELEQTVLGDLSFDLPVHGLDVDSGDPSRLVHDADTLAEVVRGLLSLDAPVADLAHALEAHGARVFRMPLERGTLGAFFFAGETAPAFLVNVRLSVKAAPIALAHLYAHFLVDTDPYTPTVCRSASGRTRASASEAFADTFADALLAPSSALEPFLASPADEPPVAAIASYLELPESFVGERLASLGVEGVEPIADDDWWDDSEAVVFPERFVALALEGIHEDALDVEEFAEWLGLSREDAVSLLALSAAPVSEDDAPSDGGGRASI